MNLLVFIVSISAICLMLLGSIPSLFDENYQFFPPPHKDSWQYRVFWVLFRIMFLGLIILSFSSFNSQPVVNELVRYLVWLPMLVLGFGAAIYASFKLGWENSHGLREGLVVTGWYRWSRNPIYVVSFFGMLGWGLFVNSFYVYIVLAFWAALYFVAPFAEEPWLEKQYGKDFLSYKAKVPRFLGFRKLERT